MDDRANALLKALIERYIADGQPVGSRTLSKMFDLSPATIRNVMADLEELGLIHSPHTSAGRVPTPRGYRMFVDHLLAAQQFEALPPSQIRQMLPAAEPSRAVSAAATLLSTQIGRASCRERGCPSVSISVGAVSVKKKKI